MAKKWTDYNDVSEAYADLAAVESTAKLMLAVGNNQYVFTKAQLQIWIGTLAAAGYLAKANNLSDLANAATARTNLGLGGLAILDPADLESGGSDELEISLSQIPGLAAAYQPLDSDLTAIAALSTTSFGRAFLALADEAAFKAAVNLELGTDVQAWNTLLQAIADAASFDAAGLLDKSSTAQTKLGNIYLEGASAAASIQFLNFSDRFISWKGRDLSGNNRFTYELNLSDEFVLIMYSGASGAEIWRASYGTPFDIRTSHGLNVNSGPISIGLSNVINSNRIFILRSYTVATLPSAVTGGQIYVSDETGGAVPAFSDGTNWRRVTDRAVVS